MTATSSTLNIGKELHGENAVYRIESVLGQGSFGITYKAKAYTVMKGKFGEEQVESSKPKAIKEFFMKEVNERDPSGSITGMSEGSLSYNYGQKFIKEAENLASMNHPNIVKVIDFISANNTYYYVMDYIDGENLNDYLMHHKLSEDEAVSMIKEVAKALRYMHEEKHMLHLDLKPGNIMRRKSDGHLFLIDFGLSKHYSDDGMPETSTSVGLGTPGYAPIEQANSGKSKQFRATLDVYALGATFYKLLTGETPPDADELVSDEDLVKENLQKHGIGEKLVDVIGHAMMPGVKHRTQSVEVFLTELCADQDDEATVVAEESKPGNAPQEEIAEEPKYNVHKEKKLIGESKLRNKISLWFVLAAVFFGILQLIKSCSDEDEQKSGTSDFFDNVSLKEDSVDSARNKVPTVISTNNLPSNDIKNVNKPEVKTAKQEMKKLSDSERYARAKESGDWSTIEALGNKGYAPVYYELAHHYWKNGDEVQVKKWAEKAKAAGVDAAKANLLLKEIE